MKWDEVREQFPDKWVKLSVLKYHIDGNREYIDDMDILKVIETDIEAGREMGNCKDTEVVYHTFHDEIYLEIKNMFGFRKVK